MAPSPSSDRQTTTAELTNYDGNMSDRSTATISDPNHRLPFALAGAALVAFAALFITAERFLGLPVLALLLIGTYTTHWRLSPSRLTRWILRLALFGTIAAVAGLPRGDVALWYMKPEYTNVIGFLLSAELVLRAWQRPEPAQSRQTRAMVLFLTALIITAASNTYDRQPMHTFIPIYILLVALSLRSITKAGQPSGPAAPRRNMLASLLALRGVALLLAMALGFSVVFLLTRYDNRLTAWAVQFLRQDKTVKGSSIGLNSAPRLRRVFNPQPSMERLLLIDGSASERHLRVMAFDLYEKGEWRPSAPQRSFTPAGAERLVIDQSGARLQIKRLSDAIDLLVIPMAIPSDASAIVSAGPFETDDLGSLRDPEPGAHPSYEVVVQRLRDVVPLAAAPDAAQRARALGVPHTMDPKVIELSRQIVGDAQPAERVQRIAQYLRSHHEYSLSYDPASEEPLNDFLLNRRAAHCQYFASAVVVMARAAGVPARLVTGYYAHERFGNRQLVVRDRDAHAWAECWIDGQGWITVDATPAGGRPDTAFPEASKWRQWWEWFTDLPGRFRQWLADIPRQTLVMLIVVIAALTIVIWLARTARKRRRRSKPTLAGGYAQPSEELAAASQRFEQWLRRQNLSCAPNRTWREHLCVLSRQSPLPIDACLSFVETYDQARFGGAAQLLSQLKAALDHLEQSPALPGSTHHG